MLTFRWLDPNSRTSSRFHRLRIISCKRRLWKLGFCLSNLVSSKAKVLSRHIWWWKYLEVCTGKKRAKKLIFNVSNRITLNCSTTSTFFSVRDKFEFHRIYNRMKIRVIMTRITVNFFNSKYSISWYLLSRFECWSCKNFMSFSAAITTSVDSTPATVVHRRRYHGWQTIQPRCRGTEKWWKFLFHCDKKKDHKSLLFIIRGTHLECSTTE